MVVKGRVKFYDQNKGYGFIERNNGKDDVHLGPDSFNGKAPADGDQVEFKVVEGSRGPHAVELKIVEDEATSFLKKNVLDLQDEDYDDFCDTTESYAHQLKEGGLETSMLRKIYSRIMNAERPAELKMLRPQFAYTAGRNEEKGVRDLMNLLDHLVKKMENDNKEQLDNFKKFMEAVVAYRKYVGGDK